MTMLVLSWKKISAALPAHGMVSHQVPLQKNMEWSSVDPDPDCGDISKFVKKKRTLTTHKTRKDKEKMFFSPEAGVEFHGRPMTLTLNISFFLLRWPGFWGIFTGYKMVQFLSTGSRFQDDIIACLKRWDTHEPIIGFLAWIIFCHSPPLFSGKPIGQCTMYFPQRPPPHSHPPPSRLALPTDANATLRLEARFQGAGNSAL